MGVVVPLLARLVWWRGFSPPGLGRLIAWSCCSSALALIGGLLLFGRDGRMASYGTMLVACAVSLWWRGFR